MSVSAIEEISHVDLEQGGRGSHRPSVTGSEGSCFTDAEEEGSCYSQFYSTTGGSYDDYSVSCVSDDHENDGVLSRRVSSVCDTDDCSVVLEMGSEEVIVNLESKGERVCRICHMGLESNNGVGELGGWIQLGCSCKHDLASAHKQCAETWFKIRGNKTCEICHSIARNVVGPSEVESLEQPNEANSTSTAVAVSAAVPHPETRSFWQGQRLLNFLLACMVFAFVISWLFHFNVPSS